MAGRKRTGNRQPEMGVKWRTLSDKRIVLKEHEAAGWLSKDELDSVSFLPADAALIEKLSKLLQRKRPVLRILILNIRLYPSKKAGKSA